MRPAEAKTKPDFLVKTIAFGDNAVGKTAVAEAFFCDVSANMSRPPAYTMSVDFFIHTLSHEKKGVQVRHTDTNGGSVSYEIYKAYTREQQYVILFASVSSPSSWEQLVSYKKMLEKRSTVPTLIAATFFEKSHLTSKFPCMDKKIVGGWSKKLNAPVFYCCPELGRKGVSDLFEAIAALEATAHDAELPRDILKCHLIKNRLNMSAYLPEGLRPKNNEVHDIIIPERFNEWPPRLLSHEDRIALSKYAMQDDMVDISMGLSANRFIPSDFVSFSESGNALLTHSPFELSAHNQHWSSLSWMLSKLSPAENLTEEEHQNMKFVCAKVLLIAAFHNQTDVVLSLLSFSVGVNQMVVLEGKFKGFGPLHFAVYYESEPLIRALMEAGVNQVATTLEVASALDFSVFLARNNSDYWKFIPLLTPKISTSESDSLVKQAYARALLVAVIHNQLDVAKHLLSAGADPNMMVALGGEHAGCRALHFAFRNNSKELAFYLLAAGADPDLKAENGHSFRSLIGGHDLLKRLIDMPSDQRILAANNLIKDCYEKLFHEDSLQQVSFSETLSDGVSAVRKKLFSLFSVDGVSKEAEALKRAAAQQKLEIKENAEQIRGQDGRMRGLEEAVLEFKQQQVVTTPAVPAMDSLFRRERRKSPTITPGHVEQGSNARGQKVLSEYSHHQ